MEPLLVSSPRPRGARCQTSARVVVRQVHPGATVKEAVHFILDTAVSGQVVA